MNERSLRSVLLVRSVEETDPDGVLLPRADRAEATRTVLREQPQLRDEIGRPDPVPGLERFLAARARHLLARLTPRHPALATLAAGADRLAWLGRVLVAGAFLLGLGLSVLDRSRLVNVLAFPLAGLIAWNLCVYVAVLAHAVRGQPRVPVAAAWYERWLRRRLERWLKRSAEFDASLTHALRAFVGEWLAAARPVLAAHATRLFHVAALTVALGLIAGMYWRGLTLEYRAGWESTFLSADGVRTLLHAYYGLASALTGIPLPPDAAAVEALHWRDGAGGVLAAPWIHLLAVTALLWIVVPRALLALAATWRAAALARRAALPPATIGYARDLLGGQGVALGGAPVDAIPYAFEPPAASDRALGVLLETAFGSSVRVALRPPVAYGDEERFVAAYPGGAGARAAVLCSLASTPEAENHGALIAGVRDAVMRRARDGRVLVVVDATAYARRMGEGALAGRLAERARTWLDFVHGYGVDAAVVDLERLAADAPEAAAARVRDALAAGRR